MVQRYIWIDNNGNIGFKSSEFGGIVDTDVPITDEIYGRYFMESAKGEVTLKNIYGETFEDMFNVTYPPPVYVLDEPVDIEQQAITDAIIDLYERLLILEGGGN